MIKSINHVAVIVTDVDRAKDFYQRILGSKRFRARRRASRANGSVSALIRSI